MVAVRHRLRFPRTPALAGAIALALLALPAAAQEAQSQPAATQPAEGPTTLTADDVRARLARIEADQTIPENARVEASNLYKQALDQLAQVDAWRQKADEFRQGRENVPTLLEEVRARLEQLNQAASQPATRPSPERAGASLEELSRTLRDAEADLKTRQDNLQRLKDETQQRADRRLAIPKLLTAASANLESANRGLAETPGDSVPPQVQLARRTLLTAQRSAAQEEIRAYQEELQFYDARNDVLAMRTDEAQTLASRADVRVTAWRDIVGKRREAEAAKQREQAETELRRSPAAIRELARRNNELAKEWSELGPKMKTAEEDAAAANKLHDSLTSEFGKLKSQSNVPEMADLIGPMMREQRAELTRLRRYGRELEQARADHAQALLQASEIEAENATLLDLGRAVDEHLAEISPSEAELSTEQLRARVEDLLKARQETVKNLKRDYATYSADLLQLETNLSLVLSSVNEMATFIDERVLWVPSAAPIYRTGLELHVREWRNGVAVVMQSWWAEIRELWWGYLLALAGYAFLLRWQPHLRRSLRESGELVSKPLTDRYSLTLRAVADTLGIALPVPLLLWLAGWRLEHLEVARDATAFDLARSAAGGLSTAGTILFVLLAVRHACRHHGIAVCHFRWDAKGLSRLRRHMVWFAPVTAPLAFVVVACERYTDPAVSASVGRLAFLAALVASVAFVRQAFHPERGALAHYFTKRPSALVSRLSWPTYAAVLLLLLGLAIASAVGYHYTAIELFSALIVTLTLTLVLVLLHALAVRWVFYTQRKLAIEEARRRRAEMAAESREGETSTVAPDVDLDDTALNIGAIGEQTRQLLSSFAWLGVVGIVWYAWADLLPAFSFLHKVTLWTYMTEAPVSTNGAAGPAATGMVVESITLASVLAALLILAVAYVLARNMPGLLEIAVLRRLPLDAGSRFAISAVSRYVIVVVGACLAFGTIGVGWAKVQWLVAAVTVGLGFGLQEIFANFVSGLILLFERPIRIGDTVTVGEITGIVTRIRIRATTITDWDRKELVIPNKEFVTGQVVNWSLSDQVLRLVIRIGIAYGSDVQRAKQILLDIAHANSLVLEQPKPHVWFLEFGDSALNFEVRAFVKDIDDWIRARDALHFEIDAAFREAGIEIAFPQRDIHVRSIPRGFPIPADEAAAPPIT